MSIKRTKGGFTLVELIICMGILSIISVFALPHLKNYFIRQEIQYLHQKLKYSIKIASYSALIHHSNAVICPSQTTRQCDLNHEQWNEHLIIFLDKNKNRQVDSEDQLISIEYLKLKYGNLIWRGTLSQPSLTFRASDGLPIGSNGSFFYCSTTQHPHHRFVLSKMGHLRHESHISCTD